LEKLGTSDRGVILFRKMLEREIERVAGGEDPMGVIRDPEKNTVIDLHVEYNKNMLSDSFARGNTRTQGRHYPYRAELTEILAEANRPLAATY